MKSVVRQLDILKKIKKKNIKQAIAYYISNKGFESNGIIFFVDYVK